MLSAGLTGTAGQVVEVEADIAFGLPQFVVSGLPDAALHESRDRVRAAVVNAGEEWPARRVTINLLPAPVRKQGSSYDLAIAIALLGGTGRLPLAPLDGTVLIGELGLDGRLRPVRGVLPMVAAGVRAGHLRAIVPTVNGGEAALVPGAGVRTADSLNDVIRFVRDGAALGVPAARRPGPDPATVDMADVAGQEYAKFVLEIAAAGGHHLSMIGPPGAGKTMLAARLPTILPALDDTDAIEVTSILSIAGKLPGDGLVRRPPFMAPHHTSSPAALIGGGSGLVRPGALSFAHRGVLFLDEVAEFPKAVLETLRQPLEEGVVRLGRTREIVTLPARVQLVTAANPCRCAKPGGDTRCECTPLERRRYLGRLSGPLLDRIDLHLRLEAVTAASLLGAESAAAPEDSATMAARVAQARAAAAERWRTRGWRLNAEADRSALALPDAATADVRHRIDTGQLSARGVVRVLRVAWTIADLRGAPVPGREDVTTALGLRLAAH